MKYLLLAFVFSTCFANPNIRFVEQGGSALGNASGTYWQNTGYIFIDKNLSPKDTKWVIDHETCHYTWYEDMTKQQRSKYRYLLRKTKYYPTEYSHDKAHDFGSENFAEVCAQVKSKSYEKNAQTDFIINLFK